MIFIGVHTGEEVGERVNYGTLITPHVHQWLKAAMDEMLN